MTIHSGSTGSIIDRVRPIAAGAAVVAIHFIGRSPAFVLGEEAVLLAGPDGELRRVAMHAGGILAAAGDDRRVVTAGDDGKVAGTGADGAPTVIGTDADRRWVDHVAVGPAGAVAWSVGKSVVVRTRVGELRSLDLPSSVGGLAFAPRGFRLAMAHYNGVTLWFPNTKAGHDLLEWKGSHVGVTFSPDGRFLVTAMQEPTLHGWRLADRKHMRMSGYAAKVRSFGWTAGGKWLATAGAEELILWPFHGKDGPMGKPPRMLAPRNVRVTTVGCHPSQELVAVGYADGMVALVRIEDGAEILARKAGGIAVTALAWSKAGDLFAYGTEDGDGGLLAF